ncbi:MAG: hypothetical protein PHE36_06635 [Novosphingobium sp.]|nr:hypothetical protein [Novosphingobium sp.]
MAAAMTWAALQDAAAAVAMMAGLEPEPATAQVRDFPALIRNIGGWRRRMAESGIADLAAIMEPGLSALLAAKARGADAAPAALALWREFQSARAAILALVPKNMAPRTPRNA